MEWVETTAKSVEEAKSLALDQLGVAEEDAEFEILDEPRPGLFGRVRGEARVRARVRPTRPRPKLERRDRKRKGGKSEDRSGRESSSETSDAAAEPETSAAVAVAATSTRSGGRSNPRRGTPRAAAGESTMTTDDTSASDAARSAEPAPDAAVVGAAAVDFLTGLVGAFGLSADVTLHDVEDEMEVRVDGDNLGLLVGPRGATLLAIQDVTRVASQRRLGDHQTRLRIDVAGYREKRREALSRFAQKLAAEVMETGEERVLEPMPSADRKVIHDTLSDVSGVATRSEGDDPRRYVVIAPAG